MYDPKVRLKTLAALVDYCQGLCLCSGGTTSTASFHVALENLSVGWIGCACVLFSYLCVQVGKGASWPQLSMPTEKQETHRWERWFNTSSAWCHTLSSTSSTGGSMTESWRTPTTRCVDVHNLTSLLPHSCLYSVDYTYKKHKGSAVCPKVFFIKEPAGSYCTFLVIVLFTRSDVWPE